MMKHWLSTTLSRLGIALTRQRRPSRDAPPPVFEPLEPRLLLNGALPMIDRIEADNRGLIDLHVTAFLNPTTVTADAVRVTTAGKDLLFGTADDVQAPLTVSYDDQARRIRIQADVPLDARYRVEVDGDAIRDLFATPLDAEFNGPGLPTGDGTAGGDLVFFTRKASSPTARLLTTAGEIRVELFPQDAPKTVANFIAIANRGDYDGVVFHRLVKDFVAQGGGFQADPLLAPAPAVDPVVNEFKRSNVRGTIAMAKRGNDPNSATNQWFFNLADNSANLDLQNGGFTVFGQVDAESLAVLDTLNGLTTIDASSAFGPVFQSLPLRQGAMVSDPSQLTAEDLVVVDRAAILMDLSATPPDEFSAASIVFTSSKGARVEIFDLTGAGLDQDAVKVAFEGREVRSIVLSDGAPTEGLGVAVSGARFVGSIRDARKAGGDIAFVVSDAPVGAISLRGDLTGENLEGLVVGGVFVNDDLDGDGQLGETLALYVQPADKGSAPPLEMRVDGRLLADAVVQTPVATLSITGEARDADILIQPTAAGAPLPSLRIDAGLFEDVSLTTTQPIATLKLGEWRDGDLTADQLHAPSVDKLMVTGKGAGVRNGDFEADASFTGAATGGLTVGSVDIAGVAFSAEFDVAGAVGKLRLREGATGGSFSATGAVKTFLAGSLNAFDFSAGGEVSRIVAPEWIGGSIAARSVGSILITGKGAFMSQGDLNADLSLNTVDFTVRAAGKIRVAGDAPGVNWTFMGSVNALDVRGDIRDATIDLQGGRFKRFTARRVEDSTVFVGIGSKLVRFASWEGGQLSAGATSRIEIVGDRKAGVEAAMRDAQVTISEVGLFRVAGDVQDVNFSFTKNAFFTPGDAVKQLRLEGVVENTAVRANAPVRAVKAGAFVASSVLVGAPNDLEGFPDAASRINPLLGFVGRIEILGTPDAPFAAQDAFFVAPRIGSITLGVVDTTTGSPWGVAAGEIKRVSFVDEQGQPTVLEGKALNSPLAAGDFQIRPGFASP